MHGSRRWRSSRGASGSRPTGTMHDSPVCAGDIRSITDRVGPALRVITRGHWLKPGGAGRDSICAEPIDVPNVQRALLVYVPSLRWAYSSAISEPSQFASVAERLRTRGWKVDVVDSPRSPARVAP